MRDPAYELYRGAKARRDKKAIEQIERFYFSKHTTAKDIRERQALEARTKLFEKYKGKLPPRFYSEDKNRLKAPHPSNKKYMVDPYKLKKEGY